MSRPVIPVRSLSMRLPDAGRIRIGTSEKAVSKKGTEFDRPVKLQHFRFTSADPIALQQVADIYGGTVTPWAKGAAGQHELLTNATEIRIALPPDPLGNTPIYEMWEGGGCQRRCDGETCEMLVQGHDGIDLQQVGCICAAKGELACKVTTRLSVLLPEVRFVGVWRLDTHGWNAAQELPGMVELIRSLQEKGIVRGILRVEARTQVLAGKTREFMVPVLGVDETVEALAAGASRMTAIGSAVPLRPELTVGSTDGGGSASRSSDAASDAPRESAPGEGASPAVDPDSEVVDAEIVDDGTVVDPCAAGCGRTVRDGTPIVNVGGRKMHKACTDDGPSTGAMKHLHGLLKTARVTDANRHAWATERLGRHVGSFTELSAADVDQLIEILEPAGAR